MFQLDNEKYNISNEKNSKQSINRKLVIFLFVFALICIGTTILAIKYTNLHKQNNNVNSEKEIEISNSQVSETTISKEKNDIAIKNEDNLKIKNLSETYDNNDIDIIEEIYTEGEGKKMFDEMRYPLSVRYIQIDGLKNKEIQNKINKEIKENVFDIYNKSINIDVKDFEKNNVVEIYAYTYLSANYSNVISVLVNIGVVSAVPEVGENILKNVENICLNYDLTTGKKIEFEDLFISGTNINNILNRSIYNSFALKEAGDTQISAEDIDYSNFSEKTMTILNKYKKEKEHKFLLTDTWIMLIVDEKYIYINMKDYYKNIAIFKRYLKNDIYDGRFNNEKDIIIFSKDYLI